MHQGRTEHLDKGEFLRPLMKRRNILGRQQRNSKQLSLQAFSPRGRYLLWLQLPGQYLWEGGGGRARRIAVHTQIQHEKL